MQLRILSPYMKHFTSKREVCTTESDDFTGSLHVYMSIVMTAVEASLCICHLSTQLFRAVRSYVDPVPFHGNALPDGGAMYFLAVPRSSTHLHFGRVGRHAVTASIRAPAERSGSWTCGDLHCQVAALPPAQLRATAKAHVLACHDPTRPSTSPPLARMPAA